MLKKVAIALGVLVVLIAGATGWLWHQATALPEWYTEGDLQDYAGEELDSDGPVAPPQWIALDEQGERLPSESVPLSPADEASGDVAAEAAPDASPALPPPRRARKTRANAKRHELRGFHRRNRKGKRSKGNPAIKASRAVYEDGSLEIGVILELARLPRDKLKPRDRERYDRAVRNFPGITNRDVWVGVEDEAPITVGGYLQLSTEAEVRVGKLTYSLTSAAKRMGMSELGLRMELNRELRRLGFVDPGA